jgi:flagellar biosynthetic protein FliP
MNKLQRGSLAAALGGVALVSTSCVSPQGAATLPKVTVGVDAATSSGDMSTAVQVIVLLTVLTLAPSLLVMVTSFTRTVIVLSLVRNAMGVMQLPPNQVLIGLSLFLTLFVMAPTFNAINDQAVQPYMAGEISQQTAFSRGEKPIRAFMFKQTREKDLALFIYLAKEQRPRTLEDVPTYVLIPAFIISELKTAFQMGLMIFLPFLVIDLAISTILMSMGMMMLPPVMISLPFKLLLFVLVDGWHLIARSLVLSFG